jgi:hypothetical protein
VLWGTKKTTKTRITSLSANNLTTNNNNNKDDVEIFFPPRKMCKEEEKITGLSFSSSYFLDKGRTRYKEDTAVVNCLENF